MQSFNVINDYDIKIKIYIKSLDKLLFNESNFIKMSVISFVIC